jgi:ferredoxin
MSLKVIVDEALCAGRGQCAVTAPEIFKLDDEGYCTLAGQGPIEIPDSQANDARAAGGACPEGAIRVTDEE